jgi:hypothetical protein
MTEPSDKDAAAAPTADDIIADCDGDPRAAVIELLAIVRSLIHENQALREYGQHFGAAHGLPHRESRRRGAIEHGFGGLRPAVERDERYDNFWKPV